MKLYNYFRSSASFRVRIALNLKGLAYDYVPVHLAKGEQKQPEFAALTAEGLVPLLELPHHLLLLQRPLHHQLPLQKLLPQRLLNQKPLLLQFKHNQLHKILPLLSKLRQLRNKLLLQPHQPLVVQFMTNSSLTVVLMPCGKTS